MVLEAKLDATSGEVEMVDNTVLIAVKGSFLRGGGDVTALKLTAPVARPRAVAQGPLQLSGARPHGAAAAAHHGTCCDASIVSGTCEHKRAIKSR